MTPRIRSAKNASVAYAYAATGRADSDQSEVWDQISALDQKTSTHSQTSAMRDIFEHCWADIEDVVRFIAVVPEQKGILVFVKGEVIGMDILSRSDAFARVAPRLLKSYAMEAILAGDTTGPEVTHEQALTFLRSITSDPEVFPSVGKGDDLRFKGDGVVGSALVVDDTVIHASFFRVDRASQLGRVSTPIVQGEFRTGDQSFG